jgi:hypothetical protein
MRERELTVALQALLHRNVWILTQPFWRGSGRSVRGRRMRSGINFLNLSIWVTDEDRRSARLPQGFPLYITAHPE